MRPEDRYSTSRFHAPRSDGRTAPVRQTPTSNQRQNAAAADYVRGQINNIYDSTATELSTDNPYQRTHTTAPQPNADQWRQYQSAWQNYYQKYYERYYLTKIHEAQAQMRTQAASIASKPAEAEQAPDSQPQPTLQPEQSRSIRSEALMELRRNLRNKV